MSSPPQVSLGASSTYTPLTPKGVSLSTDNLVRTILQAAQGGRSTAHYFNQLDVVGKLYEQLKNDHLWATYPGKDGTPLIRVAQKDSWGNEYSLTMTLAGLSSNANNSVSANGSSWILDGTTYHGVGRILQTISYPSYTIAEISWELGITADFILDLRTLKPLLWKHALKVGASMVTAMRGLLKTSSIGGYLQNKIIEFTNEGNSSIAENGIAIAQGPSDVNVTALTSGALFLGSSLQLAAPFSSLSTHPDYSYHTLRLWNLTRYNIRWVYWFDTLFGVDQGELIFAPLDFQTLTPAIIQGASVSTETPKIAGTHKVKFADFYASSSEERGDFRYALQLKLQDPRTDKVVYTLTVSYYIPFSSGNSTDLTFDQVVSLAPWFRSVAGTGNYTSMTAISRDSKIRATSTYDYLDDQTKRPDDKAHYYRSLLCVEESDLIVNDLPST